MFTNRQVISLPGVNVYTFVYSETDGAVLGVSVAVSAACALSLCALHPMLVRSRRALASEEERNVSQRYDVLHLIVLDYHRV